MGICNKELRAGLLRTQVVQGAVPPAATTARGPAWDRTLQRWAWQAQKCLMLLRTRVLATANSESEVQMPACLYAAC